MSKYKSQEGSIHIFLIASLLTFILISFFFGAIYFIALNVQMNSIKNKVDFANLATYKNVSQTELSINEHVVFDGNSVDDIYNTFHDYLEKNLNTDDALSPKNENSNIASPYTIKRMIIYSIENNQLSEYEYSNGDFHTVVTYGSTATTPSGAAVKETSVYTEVGYKLNLPFGKQYSGTVVTYTSATNTRGQEV